MIDVSEPYACRFDICPVPANLHFSHELTSKRLKRTLDAYAAMGATHSSLRPQGMVLPGSYLGELGGEVQYERRYERKIGLEAYFNRLGLALMSALFFV